MENIIPVFIILDIDVSNWIQLLFLQLSGSLVNVYCTVRNTNGNNNPVYQY